MAAISSRRAGSIGHPVPPRQARLTPMDAAFLALESAQAPMHLGWAATFAPPVGGPRPTFEAIRAHIEARLGRAPRYRQRVVDVPLGLAGPAWVDDRHFDIRHHVRRASATDLGELVDEVMSLPLAADRPLWELWIAEQCDDGRVGVVGKAHHCLVDGIAAVELMALLLDADPEAEPIAAQDWNAAQPDASELLGAALRERAASVLAAERSMLGWAHSSHLPPRHAQRAMNSARVVVHSALPPAPPSRLNGPLSAARHLAWISRPLEDLKIVARHFGTTVNDVLLAASAGALRELALARSEQPERLKATVPVSVRAPDERWGNRIAFVFAGLPCEEPDAVRRLSDVHVTMAKRKHAGEPETADALMAALGHAPRPLRRLAARGLSSPRLANLIISNVPGPPVPLYLMGCEVQRAYPVVPLTAGHRISIGMTTVNSQACFGVYADAQRATDADLLARSIGAAIDELLDRCACEQP